LIQRVHGRERAGKDDGPRDARDALTTCRFHNALRHQAASVSSIR
jgi:hypothetical protein